MSTKKAIDRTNCEQIKTPSKTEIRYGVYTYDGLDEIKHSFLGADVKISKTNWDNSDRSIANIKITLRDEGLFEVSISEDERSIFISSNGDIERAALIGVFRAIAATLENDL